LSGDPKYKDRYAPIVWRHREQFRWHWGLIAAWRLHSQDPRVIKDLKLTPEDFVLGKVGMDYGSRATKRRALKRARQVAERWNSLDEPTGPEFFIANESA
jgi:hypothetical protein